MKIDSISISNFRGVKHARLENLGTMVVIAGANGSGKSCIFDAIRLTKSVYGGYQQNEWQHWLGEFQINIQSRNSDNITSLLYNKSKPAIITIEFRLHPDEREYLRQNGEELVRESVWRVIAPELYGWSSFRAAPMAAQLRSREPEVEQATARQTQQLMHELASETIVAHVEIGGKSNFAVHQSKSLELVFGNFLPKHLGVIDYHGPQRFFNRELVQGINLTLETQEQQQSHHALYNYSNKYNNVKNEMASSFIKEMIAESAGSSSLSSAGLTATLKELFEKFFPDKKFLGPKARIDGALDFPVETKDGTTHDLNELSAGEKEILFGYLRMRSSAPKYSIVLIDEPEIHLNPRLIQGLPSFYSKHLGQELDNQVWLVTHSDAILREVVGMHGYSSFHMTPAASTSDAESQAQPLAAGEAVERAIISLVGDLATYRPGGKVVIFEGGGDSEFDREMVGRLFPGFQEQANFISGGNKTRVRNLHSVLDKAAGSSALPFKVFSIADRDSDGGEPSKSAHSFTWDRYHIENYLLDEIVIFDVLQSLSIKAPTGPTETYEALRECARETMGSLVRHELGEQVNRALISTLSVKIDPSSTRIALDLRGAAERSADRLSKALEGPLDPSRLQELENELVAKLEFDLAGDKWKSTFRGRDILKRFAGQYAQSIPYESFRNLIVSRHKEKGIEPKGMKVVIDAIIASS